MAADWRPRFIAFVEVAGDNEKCVRLTVRIPRAMADAVERHTVLSHVHPMVFYRDAFAGGLSDALTKVDAVDS